MKNVKDSLTQLLEVVTEEHGNASIRFNFEKSGENGRRLRQAMDNLEAVISLCEANGVEVN